MVCGMATLSKPNMTLSPERFEWGRALWDVIRVRVNPDATQVSSRRELGI